MVLDNFDDFSGFFNTVIDIHREYMHMNFKI